MNAAGPQQWEESIGANTINLRNITPPCLIKQQPDFRRSFSEPNLLTTQGFKSDPHFSSLNKINLNVTKLTFRQFLNETRPKDVLTKSSFQLGPDDQVIKIDAKLRKMVLLPKNDSEVNNSRQPYSPRDTFMLEMTNTIANQPKPDFLIKKIQATEQRAFERSLSSAAQLNSIENSISQCHVQEQRLARISTSIVWLFLICHTWRMIPTFYEFWNSDNGLNVLEWPFSLVVIEHISHSLIVLNSAINFLIYVFM